MAKFLKSRSQVFGFALIFILAIVFIIVKNFSIPVEAQGQINIFPTVTNGDWGNKEFVLNQDLGSEALFSDFNLNNSATPFLISGAEENTNENTNDIISFFKNIRYFFKINFAKAEDLPLLPLEIPTPVETLQIDTPIAPLEAQKEISSPTDNSIEIQDTTDSQVPQSVLGATDEAQSLDEQSTPAVEPEQDANSGIISPDIIPIEEESGKPKEESQETENQELITKFLELSNFSVPDSFKDKEILLAQLRLSLAGRGLSENAALFATAYYNDAWQNLGVIKLDQEFSNSTNGGYFLYALPIFEDWDKLENLKIKIKYEQQGTDITEVYLDAVWLEVEYAEFPTVEEIKESVDNLDKADYKLSDNPEFSLDKFDFDKNKNFGEKITTFFFERETKVVLFDPTGKDISAAAFVDGDKIRISSRKGLRPGLYKLKVSKGDDEPIEKDFNWGVLAINTNKTIYNLGDNAYLQIATLNDYGHTICDANLVLEITAPDGNVIRLTTDDGGITRGLECGANNVTDSPDYYAYYPVSGVGKYQIKLTAQTSNGLREITDRFEVKDIPIFEVERIGATRINPFLSNYKMFLKIKTNRNFVGKIIEKIPNDFEIIESGDGAIENIASEKEIVWEVSLQDGQEINLQYEYKTPEISPQIFLLGPVEFKQANKTLFKEIRQWQLASDASCASAGNGNWGTGATWSSCGVNGPVNGDSVSIGAHTITGDTTVSGITSITFTSTGTLNINTGITVTTSGAVTLNGSGSANTSAAIGGLGTLSAASVAVGTTVSSWSSNTGRTAIMTSTITNFNVSGDITHVYSAGSGQRKTTPTLRLNSNTMDVNGTITGNSTNCTFTMANGSASLVISNAAPIGSSNLTFVADGTDTLVNYDGAAQTVYAVAYDDLTLSTSGVKTITSLTTINRNLAFSGTASATTAANITVGGTLNVGSGTSLTIGAYTFAVTGTTNVESTGSLIFSSVTNPSKTFTGDVTVSGTWNEQQAITPSFGGSLTNNASSWTASTGTHTFTGSAKTISGSTTTVIPDVSVSGTVTSVGTMTISTDLAGAGGFTNGDGSTGTLNFGGSTLNVTTFTASANNNAVKYVGTSAQTIRVVTYHDLYIQPAANSITEILPAATPLTINGDLILGNGSNTGIVVQATTNDPNITVLGSVTVSANTTFTNSDSTSATLNIDGGLTITGIFTAPIGTTATTFTLGGNFTNNGTFNNNSGRITLDGNGGANNQTLNGTTATTTFYQLYATAGGTRTIYFTDSSTYVVVASGTLSLQGTASYTLTVTRSGSADHWHLNVNATGTTVAISYVNASWSDASGGIPISASNGTNTNGLNNTNWLFFEPPSLGTPAESTASTSASPTNSGSSVTFQATATDTTDSWKLLICKNSSAPTPSATNPTCNGGLEWCKDSSFRGTGVQSSCSYATTDSDAGDQAWYAFACDNNASSPSCTSPGVQGSGDSGSPFNVNRAPAFTVFADDTGSGATPATTVTWTSTASDADSDNVTLYVCKTQAFSAPATCTGGQWCNSSAGASNPTCNTTGPRPDGDWGAYGYIVDAHGFVSSGVAQASDSVMTISNVSPSISALTIQLLDTDDAGALTLTVAQGETTGFKVKFTVVDNNSCVIKGGTPGTNNEIASSFINVRMTELASSACDESGDYNANQCYPDASASWDPTCTQDGSTCSGETDTDAAWTCTFPLQYHADPTTGTPTPTHDAYLWLAAVQATDDDSANTGLIDDADGTEMGQFMAYDVTETSIAYGSAAVGGDSAEKTTTIIARGNVGLHEEISGTDLTGAGTIDKGQQKYALSTGLSWNDMTYVLTGVATEREIDVKKTTITLSPEQKVTYWKLRIPSIQIAGVYSGTNTIAGVTGDSAEW